MQAFTIPLITLTFCNYIFASPIIWTNINNYNYIESYPDAIQFEYRAKEVNQSQITLWSRQNQNYFSHIPDACSYQIKASHLYNNENDIENFSNLYLEETFNLSSLENILKILTKSGHKFIFYLIDDKRACAKAKRQAPVKQPTPLGMFINGTCIFLYMRNATLQTKTLKPPYLSQSFALENVDYKILEHPTCTNNRNDILKVEFINLPQGLQQFNMMLTFTNNMWRYWELSSIAFDFVVNTPKEKMSAQNVPMLMTKDVSAYQNQSFVCDKMAFIERSRPQDRNYVKFIVNHMQLQAFGIDAIHNGFSKRINDCTGFFSVPIWMGLFTAAIAMMILSFGLSVLVSTKVQDRFDNPKTANALVLGSVGD